MATQHMSITLEQLKSFDPCDFDARAKLFGKHKSINIKQALKLGVTINDILWVASKLGYKEQCVKFSLLCAQRVQHMNTDPRIQAALGATQTWLDRPCEETESAARSAAESAWSAARSAARSAAWSAAESAAWSAAESAARSAARSAAWSAAESAARSAAWSAAESAARSAAWSAESAARSAAWSAARSAAWSAAESAAWSAARSAEIAEQKKLLLQVFCV